MRHCLFGLFFFIPSRYFSLKIPVLIWVYFLLLSFVFSSDAVGACDDYDVQARLDRQYVLRRLSQRRLYEEGMHAPFFFLVLVLG
jgi:hypothetical protein